MLSLFKNQKVTRFSVEKGAIVGDFRNAMSPMVWRTDLSRIKTMTVKLLKADGVWDLALYEGKDSVEVIASFSSQAAGEQAMDALAKAMRASSFGARFLKVFLSVVAVVALLVGALWLMPAVVSTHSSEKTVPTERLRHEAGKSLSADDTLQIPTAP